MNSPFFKPEEFACKCEYEDCVSSQNFMNDDFLELLFKVRAQIDFPMVVNSAYRCEKHNRDVGGVARSNHVRGLACDVKMLNQYDRYDLVEQCISHGLSIIMYPTFLHIELRRGRPRLSVHI